MQAHKEDYLGGREGKHFEDRIGAKLKKLGYGRLVKNDIEEQGFLPLKEEILKKEQQHDIKNPFSQFRKDYIMQPYGTQNYPDFIVLDNDRVVSIEVKFSDGAQKRPVWNSGLPRPNGIYVFGARKQKDLTFLEGAT